MHRDEGEVTRIKRNDYQSIEECWTFNQICSYFKNVDSYPIFVGTSRVASLVNKTLKGLEYYS